MKRGIYSGAVGNLSWPETMDILIAIRSVAVKNDQTILQTGAAVVADSVPTSG